MDRNPKIEVQASLWEKVCNTLSVIFILITFISAIHTYKTVPAEVPIHFNSLNEPNGWGSSLNIFIVPAVLVFVFVSMYLISKKPHIHNYPVKVTDENAPKLYRLSRLLLAVLNVEIALLMAVITLEFGVSMAGHPFGMAPVLICTGIIVISLIPFVVAMCRAG